MRVAFVVPTFPAVNETFVLSQVEGLLARGHEVVVYARRPEAGARSPEAETRFASLRQQQPDLPGARLPRTLSGLRLVLRHVWRHPRLVLRAVNPFRFGRYALSFATLQAAVPVLDSRTFDVVHCHFGPGGVIGAMLQELGALRGPLVVTFYGHDVTRYPLERGPGVYERLFRRAALVLGLEPLMAARLRDLGAPADRVDVQPLSVDCTRFRHQDEPARSPLRLLSVGRLVEKKGFATALQALARARRQGLAVRYCIAGDGPLDPVLRRLASDLAIQDVVEFKGHVRHDEVPALMQASHALVVPSVRASDGDEEGTPTVILEAMACGRPTVATRHAGIPDLIEDGVTGLLATERDPDGLAACFRRLDDAALRTTLGTEARRVAESRFDQPHVTDRLLARYERVAQS